MVDDGLKDQVKEATDIAAVIGQYVTLKKRGSNLLGLCPFHTEKTPSFSVNPDRHFFHCFGCGKGGDVFAFLMDHEGWTFPEALKYCAERAGITLPERRSEDDRASRRRQAIIDSLALADQLYRNRLFSAAGEKALAYMRGRGFADATLKRAGVGYAPASYDTFLRAARGQGLPVQALEAAGLTSTSRKTGEPFDRFRNRITFPIINLSNKTVGFGARVLSPDDEPKYLNSPETTVYQKSRILYGLAQTRDAVRKADRSIIVEGYLDWLRMVEVGLDNVVAVSGTALTSHQAELLARFCRRVTLLFDADQAGQRATLRGIDVCFNAGLGVDVVVLPTGDDPDSFLRQYGKEKLEELIAAAPGIVEYRVNVARKQAGDHFDFLERERLIKELVDLAGHIEDADRREAFVSEVAGYLGIAEEHFRNALKAPAGGAASHRSVGALDPKKARIARFNQFLRVLLEDPAYLDQARTKVEVNDFEHPMHRKMYGALLGRESAKLTEASPEELGDSPEEVAAWSRILTVEIDAGARDRVFHDGLAELAKQRRPAPYVKQLIAEAQRQGDKEAVARLTAELARSMRLDAETDTAPIDESSG